jgi:hypothetical protein
MSPNDRVSVIEYGAVATVYVRPQRAGNRMRLSNDISRLTSISETDTGDLAGALELANEVVDGLGPLRKHVFILASAAWWREGVSEAIQRLELRSLVRCIAVDPRLRKFLEVIAPTLDATDVAKLFSDAPVDD